MTRTLCSQDMIDIFDSAINAMENKDDIILANMLYLFRHIAEDPSAHEALASVSEEQIDEYVHNLKWSFKKLEAEAVAKGKRSEKAKVKKFQNEDTIEEY